MHSLDTDDCIIHRATADTDCTILIVGGNPIALVEDGDDDDCIGYYQEIGEGQYLYNPYEGYSYYVADGHLRSMRGKPDDMEELDVNDGNQEIASVDGDIADLFWVA